MKNRIVKAMMISATMMMVTGCKDTTKNSEDTAKSNDVQSIETSVELPQNMTDGCLLYTSPSPRDFVLSRMPSSA